MNIFKHKYERMWAYFILVTALLVGCQGTVFGEANPLIPDEETNQVTATLQPTVSAVIEPGGEEDNPLIPETPVGPTPVPDPLRFTLPDPGALPVSAWRPALYPVPWALTDQDHYFFTRPVNADEVNWPQPLYRYGNSEFSLGIPHTGIDIVAPEGTAVFATGPGVVVWSGYGLFYGYEYDEDPYGIAVAIQHDFGYKGDPLFTVYAHMSEATVVRGQRVQTGDVLGLVGETGQTTGVHLHYEVRLGANDYFHSANPELWMSPPQGWGVLAGRVMSYGGGLLESLEMRITSLETDQRWYVRSYGTIEGTIDVINRDQHYRENFVLSGLPAGTYEIFIPYQGGEHRYNVTIYPGATTFFTFRAWKGFAIVRPVGILPTNLPEELP